MSMTSGFKPAANVPATTWPRWTLVNVKQALALLVRAPRVRAKPIWRAYARLAIGAVLALVLIAGAMVLCDASATDVARRLPRWIVVPFDEVTDFGKSGWFLWPIGVTLALIAALASPGLAHASRLVLASLSVRLAFLFAAIALPGLFATIIKRLIGRARPFVTEQGDPFLYKPFIWRADYASFPSGHAVTAFAAAVAIGLLWPRLRPVMFLYALIIAVSRVVVVAHHPSDVLAGAFVGTVGTLLVRDWFAARGLGFAVGWDGSVRALPGPSWARIKRVARALFAP
jgi:undecaprenyl-diphosphatase